MTKMKDILKSMLNISGAHFFIWLFIFLSIYKNPMLGDLIYWKVTWLLICVFAFGIWGYLWDKESNKKLKELERI